MCYDDWPLTTAFGQRAPHLRMVLADCHRAAGIGAAGKAARSGAHRAGPLSEPQAPPARAHRRHRLPWPVGNRDCLRGAPAHAPGALAHHGGAGGHGLGVRVRAQQRRLHRGNAGAPEPHVRRRLRRSGHRHASATLHPMTRRRWIADEFSTERAALTGAHAAHLARTLRARVGQEFEVACGEKVYRATVSSVADDRVEFTLGEAVASRDVVPITLLLAVFKFDRMEWAIEKCTELNVTAIVPVIARRTEKHLAEVAEKRLERWRRIVREASEQSRRTAPPEITAPMKLNDALRLDNADPKDAP